jgi:hypothetical protein
MGQFKKIAGFRALFAGKTVKLGAGHHIQTRDSAMLAT